MEEMTAENSSSSPSADSSLGVCGNRCLIVRSRVEDQI